LSGIVMVTGGARSGKSAFAEKLAKESGLSVGYIATAAPMDADMRARIARHQAQRPAEWPTFEMHRGFETLQSDARFDNCGLFLLDCLTILVTNHMMDSGLDFGTCPMEAVDALEMSVAAEVDALLGLMERRGKRLIAVTNEVGMGLVPAYRMGNLFRDIAGRLNAHVARRADEVWCLISGLPLRLK
jgi:adenosylcobinamide kinase/adenosylcobinamide-phosphate guanylyltransferase